MDSQGELIVTFADGTTATARIGLAEIVQMERKWPGLMPQVESTLFGAWIHLGRPVGPSFKAPEPPTQEDIRTLYDGNALVASKVHGSDVADARFVSWVETVQRIDDAVEDENAPDPTEPAPGRG